MTVEVRSAIDTIADLAREAFDISAPIRDIADAVFRLGGYIEEVDDFSRLYGCAVEKTGEGCFVIYVPRGQIATRRNFTVAHELGHLFLHMGYKINERLWEAQTENPYCIAQSGRDEYQANEFAAAFLMPRREYDWKLRELTTDGTVRIREVADYFNVSVEAATNRGKALGYIQR